MQLSPAAELAIRGTVTLASEYGNGPVTLDSICERRDLPKQYLVKIFGSLNRANIITTIRGKKGGYKLSRPPAEITLLDIVEAVEGPIAMNYCQQEPSQCQENTCPIRPLWTEIQTVVREKLASMSLDQCLGRGECFVESGASTPPEKTNL